MTKKLPVSLVALLLIALAGFSACRPSQQARRSNDQAARRSAAPSGGASVQQDSILMVQQRLLLLIDTMADLMEKDRGRIRQLELEIARLKAVLDRYGIQVPREPVGMNPPAMQPQPSITGPRGNTPPPSAPPAPGQQLPQGSADAMPETPSVSIRAAQVPPPSADAQSRYQTALQAFNNGNYAQALDLLTDLRRTDANSSYAPNYEYWRGESFYALGQYERAIQSFTIVLTQFPGSGKSDDAEFKIAESYDKLGDRSHAVASYERLLANYPDTEYRPRAESKLRRLR